MPNTVAPRKPRKARVTLGFPEKLKDDLPGTFIDPVTHAERGAREIPAGTEVRREFRVDIPYDFDYVIIQTNGRKRYEVKKDDLDEATKD